MSLVLDCLQSRPGESLLDVGGGTGYFTRAIAASIDGKVVVVDIKPDWVDYACGRDVGRSSYTVADARSLPYPDGSLDQLIFHACQLKGLLRLEMIFRFECGGGEGFKSAAD